MIDTAHNGISHDHDYSLIENIDFSALFKKYLSNNSAIEIVNLKSEAAFSFIAKEIEQNSEVQILAVNTPDWETATLAIKAGASGVLDARYPLDKVELIIEAIEQNCVYIKSTPPFALVFPRSHFTTELETLQYQIASQILNYWRSGEPLEFSLKEWRLDSLPKQLQQNSRKISLTDELSALMENFTPKQSSQLLEQSKQASNCLNHWFYSSAESNSGISLIRKNFWRSQILLKDKLWQTTLSWEQSHGHGTYELSLSLKKIIDDLHGEIVKYERSHSSATRMAYSAREACFRFQSAIAKSQLPDDYQSFLRGLERQSQLEILARTSSFSSLLINYLIEFVRDYRERIILADNLLYNLQQEIAQSLAEHSLEVVVHDSIPWQDLRSDLIRKFGFLSQWGSRNTVFRETLKAEILEKAKGFAFQFVLESYL